MRIYIARHCETHINAAGLVQGEANPGLNDVGMAQAEALGRALVGQGISAGICSNQLRAVQTAMLVHIELRRECPDIMIRPDPRLAECRFGSTDGLTAGELERIAGAHNLGTHPDPTAYDLRLFGGECYADVLARHLAALDEFRRLHSEKRVLLVGHRRGLRTLLHGLGLERTVPEQGEFRIIEI